MLRSISWQQYLTFIVIVVVVYYLVVWLLVFKGKLPVWKRVTSLAEDAPNEVLVTAQHVIDEIRVLFKPGIVKEELVMALQRQLRKYNGWEEPGFRETINMFIGFESQTKCSIHLGEDDQRVVWVG